MIARPPDVYIKDTETAKGRGVFASRPFREGELVDACPVILFNGAFKSIPSEVRELLFNWGVLADTGAMHGLVLGYGSLYNHDNPANMRFEAVAAQRLMHFIAVRDIGVDEELTVNYNGIAGASESSSNHWFERMGITPITGEG